MRGLAACLVGLLGLGALATMAACSDSTDSGSGGAGGSPAAAGSSGKAGSAGKAGSGGGSSECGFQSVDCSGCLQDKCGDEATACSDIDTCASALYTLSTDCVCDPAKDPAKCISDFVSENGDPAKNLATCFNANCADVCK